MAIRKCVLVTFAAVLLLAPLDVASDSITTKTTTTSTLSTEPSTTESVYSYSVKDAYGKNVSLKKFEGRVLVIVNYASKCGFTTSNVLALTELAKKYKSKGLSILVFPSNTFHQNAGGPEAVQKFAEDHPEFDVFSEIDVNYANEDPLYSYLKKIQTGFIVPSIKWNFTKFIINKRGIPVKRYPPTTEYKVIEEKILEELNGH